MAGLWYVRGFYQTIHAKQSHAFAHVSGLIRFLQNSVGQDDAPSQISCCRKEIDMQFNSAIDPDTLRAYEETHYRVLGGAPATLRIGVPNAALAELHRAFSVDCSAFVTAANPFSTLIDAEANALRQTAFEDELHREGLRFIEGMGEHPSGQWPGEPSFLILGLPLDAAKQLGARHGQNAIVWCGADAVPQLILLR
jgi:hypothetical protein